MQSRPTGDFRDGRQGIPKLETLLVLPELFQNGGAGDHAAILANPGFFLGREA